MSNFKVEIDEMLFKKMIESVKHCVATKDTRKIFEYIKLTITENKATACACDGCRAARTTIPVLQNSTTEFVCYIKPIKIKPCKNGVNKVVVECENNVATVEIMTEYGKIKYCFEQFADQEIDINKIFKDAQQKADRKFGVNPAYVKQAVTALSQMLQYSKKCVVFETQENNISPFIIKAEEGKCISEQLILPMRLFEK